MTTNVDPMRPSHATMLHLTLLSTRRPVPSKKSAPLTFDKLEEDGMRYSSVNCHDWSCNCANPNTVARYTFGEGPVPTAVHPSVYERGYVVPKGFTLNKDKHLVLEKSAKALRGSKQSSGSLPDVNHAKDGQNTDSHPRPKIAHRNSAFKLKTTPGSRTHVVHDSDPDAKMAPYDQKEDFRRERKLMWAKVAERPVSMKGAFLVSGPHWSSRGHTQQWPWKSQLQCKLWSTTNQYNTVSSSRHSGCWCHGTGTVNVKTKEALAVGATNSAHNCKHAVAENITYIFFCHAAIFGPCVFLKTNQLVLVAL